MLESGFAKGGQCQGIADGGNRAESRRGGSYSKCHCLFFILVLGGILFFYKMNINEMAPDWKPRWWMQYNATELWISFKNKYVVSPNMTDSNGFTIGGSSSAFPHTENITPTKVTAMTNTPRQSTNDSMVTQDTPVPPPLVPYKSPGQYLVEYPYEYHFIINEPKICEEQKPFLVLMVPVAPYNRAHRDFVRSTWGGESLVLDRPVKLFFLLGLHTGEGAEKLQEQLLQEGKEHQDLIQSDFLDCYKNLTIKTMVMLEWLDSYCSTASYAMKIDSDMFLNVPKLINMLLNAPKTNYMTGLVVRGAAVLRSPSSKWYVPVEVYPDSQYPPYALGLGYILSMDLPKKLVEASRHVQPLYIEDVFLGLCMKHLGIPPTAPPNRAYFQVIPVPYSRCAYSRLIATTTGTNRVLNWKDFKKPGPYCRKKKSDSYRRD